MISLSKFKKLLGAEANGLTDEEIEHIRDVQYQFARLAFDKWEKEKKPITNFDKTNKIYYNVDESNNYLKK